MRIIAVLLVALAASLGLGVPGAQAQTLTVVGEGRIQAVPDMATITMGVTTDAKTAAEALDETSAVTGTMLTLLSEIGIEPEDMQTNGLRLSPLHESRSGSSYEQGIIGYRAENNEQVKVRVLGDLGVILDDVVASGANQFHGVIFGLQEPGPVLDAARSAAVKEALRKAALYAEAAGVTLGAIQSISEQGAAMPEAAMMRANSVPIAAGSLDVSASVTVVFEISGG